MSRDYLQFNDVLAMHEFLVDEFGGEKGIRDGGALEAALFRPQSGYYQDIFQEAAALFESLVMNHSFLDGNKRIGLAATDTFLAINGYKLNVDEDYLYNWIMELLIEQSFNFEAIDAYLRKWVNKT